MVLQETGLVSNMDNPHDLKVLDTNKTGDFLHNLYRILLSEDPFFFLKSPLGTLCSIPGLTDWPQSWRSLEKAEYVVLHLVSQPAR